MHFAEKKYDPPEVIVQKPEQKPKSNAFGKPGAPSLMPDIEADETEQDLEARIRASLKKTAKDNTTIEGKLYIVSQLDTPRDVLCCKYNEEFDYLAAGGSDGIIRVYNSNTMEESFTLTDKDVKNNRAPVTCIKHRPLSKTYPITNCFTGTYANGCVKCWSYNFNQCLYTIREKRQTFGITYHPRFPKFVTFGDDLKICFYDEESRMQERVLTASDNPDKHDGHMSRVFAACFHPKNNYELITGGWDDTVQFWDLRQPYAIRHLVGVHIAGEGLDISASGKDIITAAFQKTDQFALWDYASGRCISVIEPDIYSCKLYCGKFVTKDFVVTGGTDPNMVRAVDLQTTGTAASINFLPGAVYSIDAGPIRKKDGKEHINKDISSRNKSDASVIPRIAFVSARRLYQIEFY
ncbi:unnamed protein product [Callosobruchus maculatus]|uniref:Uncharacterized protein n=1 Tax=Callosobruchus maculatus TaxID=64391 RepID=A0A653D0G1_CALMS|nr:unnamed protein product [Callosobruchus maculatus]